MGDWLGLIALILPIIVVLALMVVWVYHEVHLQKEARQFPPRGSLVEVKGKEMHVFAAGTGPLTLIFLAGHGTSGPMLDFQPLWQPLSDEYRAVVVERFGYGWSDSAGHSRDMQTILMETRQALIKADERPPYVLIPHSMSGLEAIYWAQEHPSEVQAIIGMDPCVPDAVKLLSDVDSTQLVAMYWASRVGLTRFLSDADVAESLPLIVSDHLTPSEKNTYRALFHRSGVSKDMLNELKYLRSNAALVNSGRVPDEIPMLFFLSSHQSKQIMGWEESALSYLARVPGA